MPGHPGAHILHQVTHTPALPAMLLGALVGAVVATTVVATGGLALVAVAGAGALAGGALGAMLGGSFAIKTGPIIPPCALTVLYENMPAARVGDFVACTGIPFTPIPHPMSPIAQGSMTVFVENRPAARKGDMLGCSAIISEGCSTVIIGGSTSQTYLSMTPEIPSLGDIASAIGDVLLGVAVAVGGLIDKAIDVIKLGAQIILWNNAVSLIRMLAQALYPLTYIANEILATNNELSDGKNLFLTTKYLKELIGYEVKGQDTKKLRDAMTTLSQNTDKSADNPEVLKALQDIAESRGKGIEEMKSDWEKFQKLKSDQQEAIDNNGKDKIEDLNARHTFQNHMGSESQLRCGKVTGDALGVDPVFGSLLNPTGGLVGPDNNAIDLNNSATGYHGAVHDASGYLGNYHDTGDGYDYRGIDGTKTTEPFSGQRDGIHFWRKQDGVKSGPDDAAAEAAMRGVVEASDIKIDKDTIDKDTTDKDTAESKFKHFD